MMNIYLDLYKNSEKDPLENILSLYDELLLDIQLTIHAIEKNDVKQKSEWISRILLILAVMKACLQRDQGGMVASQLDVFYRNVEFQITQANLKQNIQLLESVKRDVAMVQSAWRHIASFSSV